MMAPPFTGGRPQAPRSEPSLATSRAERHGVYGRGEGVRTVCQKTN
jgi:hypothetical protein